MNSEDLEKFFSSQWEEAIKQCSCSLQSTESADLNSFASLYGVGGSIWDELSKKANSEFALAKPALAHLKDFTLTFENELCPKLSPKLSASFLWGAIGVLLQITAENHETARTMMRMIRSIGYQADMFNSYRAALPHMVNRMKEACFDIQMEFFGFCVGAINCLRGGNGSGMYHQSSSALAHAISMQDSLQGSIGTVERLHANMHSVVEELLVKVQNLVQFNPPPPVRIKKPIHYLLPQMRTRRFFSRVDVSEKLDNIFDNESWGSFKSVALWGIGGIGKSCIALGYIETKVSRGTYDAILWVYAENETSIQQSFTDIALKLKLPSASPQTHDENLSLVRDWLQSTDYRWLLVYDNVPSAGIPSKYWLLAPRGHVIITTRVSSVAIFKASTIEITWDDKQGSEFLMFLLRGEIGEDLERERASAQELSHRLGGHPLGIFHMAELIFKRSLTITEFMRLYLKNPRRLHGPEFQKLWDASFGALDDSARAFLGVLSFLTPDHIKQSIFETNKQLPEDLRFCSDQFSFTEVTKNLLDISLIKKNKNAGEFSIHRMVQTQFRYFSSPPLLQRSFENAVSIVYQQFPRMGDENGQLYDKWARCNDLLEHVISLKDSFKASHDSNKDFKAPLQFCELLKECQRYLYESNQFDALDDMCSVNLTAVGTLDDERKIKELLPHIYSQQANMHEGLGNAKKAIELNRKGYQIRLDEDPINQALCYGFEANIGYTYNTANDHQGAMEWFEKARDRWINLVDKSDNENSYPTVLKKNMARCLVYMGELSKARSLLETAIDEFQVNKPFNWGMMAYAHHVMGLINRNGGDLEAAEASFIEARGCWQMGGQAQLNPFYGGCVYKIGIVYLDQGKTDAAVEHLRYSLGITGACKDEMPVEFARSCFKLSEALLQDHPDSTEEAEDLMKKAEEYLKKRDPEATEFLTEAAYDKFVPIFWR